VDPKERVFNPLNTNLAWGECRPPDSHTNYKDNLFGYLAGRPCVLLRMNRVRIPFLLVGTAKLNCNAENSTIRDCQNEK
jgi:hypothetical protein